MAIGKFAWQQCPEDFFNCRAVCKSWHAALKPCTWVEDVPVYVARIAAGYRPDEPFSCVRQTKVSLHADFASHSNDAAICQALDEIERRGASVQQLVVSLHGLETITAPGLHRALSAYLPRLTHLTTFALSFKETCMDRQVRPRRRRRSTLGCRSGCLCPCGVSLLGRCRPACCLRPSALASSSQLPCNPTPPESKHRAA